MVVNWYTVSIASRAERSTGWRAMKNYSLRWLHNVHTHTHIHTRARARAGAHAHTHTHTHTIHTSYIHAHTHTHTHTHMRTNTFFPLFNVTEKEDVYVTDKPNCRIVFGLL